MLGLVSEHAPVVGLAPSNELEHEGCVPLLSVAGQRGFSVNRCNELDCLANVPDEPRNALQLPDV